MISNQIFNTIKIFESRICQNFYRGVKNTNSLLSSSEISLEFSINIVSKGATIVGGCCEIQPNHIEKLIEVKN